MSCCWASSAFSLRDLSMRLSSSLASLARFSQFCCSRKACTSWSCACVAVGGRVPEEGAGIEDLAFTCVAPLLLGSGTFSAGQICPQVSDSAVSETPLGASGKLGVNREIKGPGS